MSRKPMTRNELKEQRSKLETLGALLERARTKYVPCREDGFPFAEIGGGFTVNRRLSYLVRAAPVADGSWAVIVVGEEGTWNSYLARTGLSEEKALAVFDSVQDWATKKKLFALGFKIAAG